MTLKLFLTVHDKIAMFWCYTAAVIFFSEGDILGMPCKLAPCILPCKLHNTDEKIKMHLMLGTLMYAAVMCDKWIKELETMHGFQQETLKTQEFYLEYI